MNSGKKDLETIEEWKGDVHKKGKGSDYHLIQ